MGITTASRQTKAITKVATIKVRLNSNTARHQVHGINMAASKVTAHTHHKIKATVRLLHSTATIRATIRAATTKVLLKRSMDSSLPTTNSATIHRTHQQVSMLRTVRHSRANMLDQKHMHHDDGLAYGSSHHGSSHHGSSHHGSSYGSYAGSAAALGGLYGASEHGKKHKKHKKHRSRGGGSSSSSSSDSD